ncbi:hypothetical protein GCM10028806_04420 [Spirosoma terrae]|uniref:Tetratricopeptide repeat protein n=1 Tax=Spirosoma terrae TaxID=1968276 RepID=A0A6L9LF56_9BACT|nr:hypothetical protein [Spirosoma terrae]NDU98317.1 hypothetical protein [Spirosoma terrae]
MTKSFYLIILLVCLTTTVTSTLAESRLKASSSIADDEYDRYKKKGDDFFNEGKYLEARRQYQNCLEVPGFEEDKYAKEKIEDCTNALNFRQQASDALAQNKPQEAVQLLDQLLKLNPNDQITTNQIGDFYEQEGNKLVRQKKLQDALVSYKKALRYTTIPTRRASIEIQIANIDHGPSNKIGLKVATGVVAVGAGVFAVLLRNDFQNKLSTLSQVSQTTDPTGSGIIADPVLYDQYNTAYKAVEEAQKKNGLYKASLGLAAVATVAELYLLLHKNRKAPRPTGFNWQPASQSLGLAIRYTF